MACYVKYLSQLFLEIKVRFWEWIRRLFILVVGFYSIPYEPLSADHLGSSANLKEGEQDDSEEKLYGIKPTQ